MFIVCENGSNAAKNPNGARKTPTESNIPVRAVTKTPQMSGFCPSIKRYISRNTKPSLLIKFPQTTFV